MSGTQHGAGDSPRLPPGVRAVLFVCLGNICRSPLAKGVFAQLAAERGLGNRFVIDSCGTGSWHVGSDADPRTLLVARRHSVPLSHRARQLAPLYDAATFDLLLAMDRRNETDLHEMGVPPAKVMRLRAFCPAARAASQTLGDAALDVPDPYYGGADGFERMYVMIRSACEGLLDALGAKPPQTDA